jgi:hypothetical protein
MAFSEFCKIYRQEEKFLVLNPSVPSWLVTNINGVLLLKLYSEEKSFETIAEEFTAPAPEFSTSSALKFLNRAKAERLFSEQTQIKDYKPFPLRDVYLNINEQCNLRCIYCISHLRVEEHRKLSFEDYQKLLDEISEKWGSMIGFQPLFPTGKPNYDKLKLSGEEYFDAMTNAVENVKLLNTFKKSMNIIPRKKLC